MLEGGARELHCNDKVIINEGMLLAKVCHNNFLDGVNELCEKDAILLAL